MLLEDRSSPLRSFLARRTRVYFALCFKNIPDDICNEQRGDDAENWLGLVDELVASYLSAVSSDPELNVEFILDSGVPQDCVVNRWRPLVSTSGDYLVHSFRMSQRLRDLTAGKS